KATITPTVDIPAGNVTAKATKDGQTSDASAPKEATAATPAKPSQPVVDTDLTGKAGTKDPVEVSAAPGTKVELFDKDGNKIGEATADENGKATITPTVDIPAGNVTAKATKDGQTSDASAPKEATAATPAKPVVNPVKAGGTAITGTAEAGSTVEVTLPDGSKVSAKADQDGNFSVPVSGLEEGKTVSVTATDNAGNTSDATTVTVAKTADTTAPDAPVVNLVKAGDTAVTGTAEAGSTVEVTLPDGSKVSAKADQDGNFSVPVSGLKEGDTVSVTATDDAGNTSNPTSVTVGKGTDTTAPSAPVVNPVKAGTTAVTGTAEAGSTVVVMLPDGSKVSAKADQDGNFSVPVSGLKEGDTVSVTATDDAGNTSNPTSVTVGKGTDTTAPSAPVVNPVKAGTTAVTGTAEAGSTVVVMLPDGSKVSAKADQDGNFSVPVSGLKEGDTVSVTATDDAGNTSSSTSVTVGKGIDKIAPSAPVVTTDLTGKAGSRTPIDVIAEPGTKVELFDKDGNKIGEATADETGHAVVVPTVNIPEGTVTAKATDLAGNVSGASAPMFATTSGTVDSFNNGKGSENTPTVVKPTLSGKVESSTTSAKRMNLKTRANISATEKDASTLPATGDEASIGGVVLGGILAAAGLAIAGKRRKED
ncbi:Ig-like domain-containing protein, partial [Streptococcus salivarius]|uniref:Ig-like domain-containing protein n=1 Tax=Streptococcus salivarius TaxID=1304 RepID=UPI0039C3AA53